jgi:dTDP-4-dehydrorhamnose 3,5-epimerase
MLFTHTPIPSAYLVDLEKRSDERGFFGRAWCAREFAEHGIDVSFVQGNVAVSARRGTLRGMHYQQAPHEEAKLVRCTRGSVWDVLLDLREHSPTFGRSFGVELSAATHRMLYIPPGCAHGYQSLTDDAEVFYLVSNYYNPAAERGVRYDDPAFGIAWPLEVTVLSEKDMSWPKWES